MNRISRLLVALAFLGLITVLSALFLLDNRASAQVAPPLDHFKCYITQGQFVDEIVLLRDQFADDDPRARVRTALRFCNPVEKKTGDGSLMNPNSSCQLPPLTPFWTKSPLAAMTSIRVSSKYTGLTATRRFGPSFTKRATTAPLWPCSCPKKSMGRPRRPSFT